MITRKAVKKLKRENRKIAKEAMSSELGKMYKKEKLKNNIFIIAIIILVALSSWGHFK